MRYGRSFVLTLPHYVAQKIHVQRGDTFVVVYDDERQTITYQRIFDGSRGPTVEINGRQVTSVIMP